MSDNFFFAADQEAQPRENVRIVDVTAVPYQDSARVRVGVRLTPFQERPNLEIYAQKADGPIVAEMSVIETMIPSLEFTLHIRGVDDPTGDYTLTVELYYEERTQPQDRKEIPFRVAAPASES